MPLTISRRKSTGALTIYGNVAGRRIRRRAQSDNPKLAREEAAALEAERPGNGNGDARLPALPRPHPIGDCRLPPQRRAACHRAMGTRRDRGQRGQPQTANAVLETCGLAVVIEQRGTSAALRWLLVANTHPGLAEIFEGSHWAAQSGIPAPWVQELRRVPGACRVAFHRFAGYGCRATKLPLDDLLAEPSGTSPKPMRRSTTARPPAGRRPAASEAIPFNERRTCTVKQASAFTGLGKTKLYELIGKGPIEALKIGRRRLVKVPSLLALIDASTTAANKSATETRGKKRS